MDRLTPAGIRFWVTHITEKTLRAKYEHEDREAAQTRSVR